jgi:signal transduction histidine kinase
VQLLQEDPQLTSDAQRRLKTIEAQIDQTSRIIQDLLLYARKPELTVTPVDLNACLHECIALLRPEMDRQGVRLELRLSAALPKVEADYLQIQEVFCNVIENGIDAMADGGGTMTVRTFEEPGTPAPPAGQTGRCVVEIADTGPGVAAEQVDQIFQPFFTTKKPGRGTGLGLAIASETVRAHDGLITVESEPGKGARFLIVLPVNGGAA